MSSAETSSRTKAFIKSEQFPNAAVKVSNQSTSNLQSQMAAANTSSKEWGFLDWSEGTASGYSSNFAHGDSLYMATDTRRFHDESLKVQLTPSPSEVSVHSNNHAPSGFDIQQRLLDLQPRSSAAEIYREHSQWTNSSFPPAAYYITPPPRTPEEPHRSPAAIYPAIHSSVNGSMILAGVNCVVTREANQILEPSSFSHVLSPSADEYYLAQRGSEEADNLDRLDDQRSKEPPYAELLSKCLMDAPDHQMVLKDIYEWFKINTDKTNNPEIKGWMNSIRHNLSMNQGFEKVEQASGDDGRRGYVWRLSEKALREGIQSTTRYRKKPPPGKHSAGKSRRNSLVHGSRIGKNPKHQLRRSTRIQSEFTEGGLEGYGYDTDGEELLLSPGSYVAASPSTPRGFALPSSLGSPAINPLHSSGEWTAYDTLSPFTVTVDMPRSDPRNGFRYAATSAPGFALPPPEFRAAAFDERGQHLRAEDLTSNVYNDHSYTGSDKWEDLYQNPRHSNASVDPLTPLEPLPSTVDNALYSTSQMDSCFPVLYGDGEDSGRTSFLTDA